MAIYLKGGREMKRPTKFGVICGVVALAIAVVGLSLSTGVKTVNAQDKGSGPDQGVISVNLGL